MPVKDTNACWTASTLHSPTAPKPLQSLVEKGDPSSKQTSQHHLPSPVPGWGTLQ